SPCLGVKVSIRNQDGTPAPDSTVGNIWVKGENIMLGYYKAAQKTDAIIKNGWFNTGDTGRMTTNGKLVLAGRSKDLIINKGLNIYPQEIENVLQSHNNVLLAAVIGQIMEDGQELPIAFVQLANKQEEVEQTLRSLCKERLAPYKIPRSVRVIRKMPLTASGKIDKKVLVDNNIA
ncbi:long-chain fatty acid--CoA ligase, partial [bacterium]|nr:long-chain fatty acid--CoA ligase [bacterium]